MMSSCNLLQNVNHFFSVKWKILSGIISGTFCKQTWKEQGGDGLFFFFFG